MKRDSVIYLMIGAAGFAAGFLCGGAAGGRQEVAALTLRDTVFVEAPRARDSLRVRRVVVRVPVAAKDMERDADGEFLSAAADTMALPAPDSVSVELEVESRAYSGEGYEAWVSGVSPRLDSIRVWRETRVCLAPDVEAQYNRRRGRWSLCAGAGLTAGPRGMEPGVFVGVAYNIVCF